MRRRSTSRRITLAVAAAVTITTFVAATPGVEGATRTASDAPAPTSDPEARGDYDSRTLSDDDLARSTSRSAARLGANVDLRIDPVTRTARHVSSRTGFLTGPSSRPATAVALDYVRAYAAALGIRLADLDSLRLSRRVTDLNGITHVAWEQVVEGIAVFGNGLRAHVDRRGRLIAVQGSPVRAVATLASRARPARVDRAGAISSAAADARVSPAQLRPGATAERVWFFSQGRLRPAWLTFTEPGPRAGFQHVVDATSGRTLLRRSTVNFERGAALVHENYPGASGDASGGNQHRVNLLRTWGSCRATPPGCAADTQASGPT